MTIPPDLTKRVDEARMALLALCDTLAALTLTPAPVAPPAGKYVPAVGDIVIGLFGDDGLARVDSVDPTRWSALCDGTWRSGFRFGVTSTARPATPSECAAAGLAVPPPATTPVPEVLTPDVPEGSTIAQLAAEQRASMGLTASMGSTQHFTHAATPAPEAKRPTLADVERSAEAFAHHKGDIPHSPSDAWMDGWLARDRAVAHDGIAHSTNAPCPPPVAAREETIRAEVIEECARVCDGIQRVGPWHGPDAARKCADAIRALALARSTGGA